MNEAKPNYTTVRPKVRPPNICLPPPMKRVLDDAAMLRAAFAEAVNFTVAAKGRRGRTDEQPLRDVEEVFRAIAGHRFPDVPAPEGIRLAAKLLADGRLVSDPAQSGWTCDAPLRLARFRNGRGSRFLEIRVEYRRLARRRRAKASIGWPSTAP